jgi:paraquat-inducible protein A
MQCPRCSAPLHARKPHSLARTWAFVIAASILYIPANMLPILETRYLFEEPQGNTIMDGVVLFWNSGSWFIAGLIFFASIVVPLTKLMALSLLLISVHCRMQWQPRQRTLLYRFLEFIGRWSMLDIYVVALSVALVQIEAFASMRAGLGAVAFGAVVVLTMLATQSFDPRLIWDAAKGRHD